LHGCPDGDVWSYAREHGLVLVSKDNDFRQLSFLRGAPPKVVWLRIGNGPTKAVIELLCSRKEDLDSFARDAETALITLQMERDYP
jgi:predicted nuclease of predicted toxin-antitoxin system